MNNTEWIKIINHLVGSPFEWGGRGPVAYDCWGLVIEVLRIAGHPIPGYWIAHDQARAAKIMEEQVALSSWSLVSGSPEPFDVAAMSRNRVVHHVGIVTPFGILTTTKELGAVHESEAKLRQQGHQRLEYYRWVG